MSSTIAERRLPLPPSSYILAPVTIYKDKLLTVKLPLDMLAEFSAAVDILQERSMSDAVHQYVRTKIREGQAAVPRQKWLDAVAAKRVHIEEKGRIKAQETKKRRVKIPNAGSAHVDTATRSTRRRSAK